MEPRKGGCGGGRRGKFGFDHRIGHFRPLRIIGTTPNSSALNGLGASTWDRSRWGGRRHDQGPLAAVLLFLYRAATVVLSILFPSAFVFQCDLLSQCAFIPVDLPQIDQGNMQPPLAVEWMSRSRGMPPTIRHAAQFAKVQLMLT